MKIDEAVEKYIKIRDKVAVLDEEHKLKLAPYKEAMAKIEEALLGYFNETGQESAKTAAGTAYRQKATSATVASRPEFLDYVMKHERWDLVDARAAKKNIEEFIEETQTPPPGINFSTTFKVNFRRS